MSTDLRVTDSVVIDGADLSFSAVRSSGPGGQHVNTSATKVELRFDLQACSALSDAVKARLEKLAARRIDADGMLVVVSQATRSQHRNMEDARDRLAALVRAALKPPKNRKKTRPSLASKRRRLDAKRRRGDKKKLRGPVKE